MNIEALNKVKRQSELYPHSFEMRIWRNRVEQSEQCPCGAVACIAGHVVINDWAKEGKEEKDCFNIAKTACRILDIEEHQGDKLFFLHNWPEEYAHVWQNGATKEQKCEALRNRIDVFVSSNGTV